MLKERKETMNKQQKVIRRIVYDQVGDINIEIGIVKRNKIEILELKVTIAEIKNKQTSEKLRGFNRRFEPAEERINKWEDRKIEITQSEE